MYQANCPKEKGGLVLTGENALKESKRNMCQVYCPNEEGLVQFLFGINAFEERKMNICQANYPKGMSSFDR